MNTLAPDAKLPLDACGVVETIVASTKSILAVTLNRFPVPPQFHEREPLTAGDYSIMEQALEIRSSLLLPFPMATAAHLLSQGTPSDSLIAAMRYHQHPCESAECPRESVLDGEIRRRAMNDFESFFGISSRVSVVDLPYMHLPMMDFHIAPSKRSIETVRRILKQISPCGGWILNSGKSYHFIGEQLVGWGEVLQFLAKALLFAPIVDNNWIGHQIREGACTLRLSRNPRTGIEGPVVVEKVTIGTEVG